ncbi:uncharacterized protein LOC102805586 [Saccoglossus kowalevskii]|uniref:Uncharacterized protein LOC102805586 n=1 Tax=Saccoglossus kowalevskii TaxID=10224 RepID=A0ABM0MHL7_SACKO|nr:PREDICTED: uncharacterized protein LOC102805586 [Saccoglossus kowalevskii]
MAVNIVVVESFKQSLDRAKSIYDNEPKANASSRVTYLQLIDDITIGSAFDVCIIATASPPRRKVIESLLERCKIKHLIIEKVLFQTAKDHEDVQAMFIQSGVNAYVHLQWCAIPMYKYMKDHIKGPVNLHIHGQGWGLCCNSIHLVALASYLNDSQDVRIDGSGLKPGYQESKRKGFVEVFGTLKGEVKSKHGKADFTLVCTDGPLTEGRTLHIWNDTVKMYWTEQTGSLFSSFAASDWKWERREFPFPFVSQWTNKLVKQLLETGTSDLPLYADVYQMSILLNNLYISHLADAGNADAQEGVCPIT